jgi:hypothetical protein
MSIAPKAALRLGAPPAAPIFTPDIWERIAQGELLFERDGASGVWMLYPAARGSTFQI